MNSDQAIEFSPCYKAPLKDACTENRLGDPFPVAQFIFVFENNWRCLCACASPCCLAWYWRRTTCSTEAEARGGAAMCLTSPSVGSIWVPPARHTLTDVRDSHDIGVIFGKGTGPSFRAARANTFAPPRRPTRGSSPFALSSGCMSLRKNDPAKGRMGDRSPLPSI